MKKQLKSFKVSTEGILYTFLNEGHMRFHLVAAVYVLVFANFYDMTKTKWALLVTVICLVMAAEAFNTAIETLCDYCTKEYHPMIKSVKDAASGAVLLVSIGAAAVGIILFWDIEAFKRIIFYFADNPLLIIPLALSVVVSLLFICFFPRLFKNKNLDIAQKRDKIS